MVEFIPKWKLLAGLRWDQFDGDYRTYATANPTTANPTPIGTQTAQRERKDSLWSRRFGLLFQPTDSQTPTPTATPQFSTPQPETAMRTMPDFQTTTAARQGAAESILSTNKVIRNTYLLLSLTLLFSAATAGVSMAPRPVAG